MTNMNRLPIRYNNEVAQALSDQTPVVALESNVITHGLPYPVNLRTAVDVEQAIRLAGATPATIGIADGELLVGMTAQMRERFATQEGICKVSSRDIAPVLAENRTGATSVAASIAIAEQAGIRFFSSAGIGGVHRGAETSMDISPDLIQFTHSRVAVVCAGAKNILDLRLTLEFLETHCVPLVSYRFDYFPAFYCRSSGLRTPKRMDDPHTLARALKWHWELNNPGAFLIATPTREEDAIDGTEVEDAIEKAIESAKQDGVGGSDLTKYIMHSVDRVTEGRSVDANKAVLVNTALVAGELAFSYFSQQ